LTEGVESTFRDFVDFELETFSIFFVVFVFSEGFGFVVLPTFSTSFKNFTGGFSFLDFFILVLGLFTISLGVLSVSVSLETFDAVEKTDKESFMKK
jgi:hypothetical protein